MILKTMSYYIILLSLSQQGIEKVKEIPERVENFKQLCENKALSN